MQQGSMQQQIDYGAGIGAAQRQVLKALSSYRAQEPAQRAVLALFQDFARRHPDCCERHHLPGHFTGSAWLVSADGRRVLLTHHRKLGLWLQLGGHADGDADLARVTLREAYEESGLCDLRLEGGVFDLDRHRIRAHGSDPEHWHYDVRYVVRVSGDEDFVVSEESLALAWRPIDELAGDPQADASLRRMAQRWQTHMDEDVG